MLKYESDISSTHLSVEARITVSAPIINDRIRVPFRKTILVLTPAEAQQMITDLQVALEASSQHREVLQPPRVTEDGYIDHASFFEFFGQIYPSPRLLRSHAGGLFGRLIDATRSKALPLVVRCVHCNQFITGNINCPVVRYAHIRGGKNFKIEASSLQANENEFLTAGLPSVGPALREDFQILLASLRGA